MATSEPSGTDGSLFDPAVAATIDGMGAAAAGRIWRATIDELPRLATRIAGALDRGDLHDLERAAHAGKGSSGTVGLAQLSFAMARLNAAARAGDLTTARLIWVDLQPLIERSIAAVATHARQD